jgi:hypothetical protein
MDQGTLQKARRGALSCALPIGYVHNAAGEVVDDPDEQVQHVVRLIFRKCDELGTRHALLRDLVQHDMQLGVRLRDGPTKGTLEWRRPNRMTLPTLLQNPLDAGAYAYGRRQVEARRKQPGRPSTGRVTRARQASHVLLKDHLPAYITWAQDEQHLARLEANRARAEPMGAVRHGPSLLAGILVCGKCGRRMHVRYGGPNQLHRDACDRLATDDGAAYCQYLPGDPVDTCVSQWGLNALEPAALTLSLEATARLAPERRELDCLWQQRRERAAYEAERAARPYRLREPAHRLVARQRAKDGEEKLTAQRRRQEDYQRFVQAQPQPLSATERAALAQLAHNIPALWQATTTTMAERKEMIRQLIQRVIVAGAGVSERLQITIEWVGVGTTAGITTRPIRRREHLSYAPQLWARIRPLAQEGCRTPQSAPRLELEGYRPPTQAPRFSRQAVDALIQRLGVHQPRMRRRVTLRANEWWLSDFTRATGISTTTRHHWRTRGWRNARWHAQAQRWVAQADTAALARLKQWHTLPAGYHSRQLWLDAAPPSHAAMRSVTPEYQERSTIMSHDDLTHSMYNRIMVDTAPPPSASG